MKYASVQPVVFGTQAFVVLRRLAELHGRTVLFLHAMRYKPSVKVIIHGLDIVVFKAFCFCRHLSTLKTHPEL